MVAAVPVRSCRATPAVCCAGRATTAPKFGPVGVADVAGEWPPSACGPPGPALTSVSTVTSCPSPPAGAAGGPDPAPGSPLARRHAFVASPGQPRPAPTAAPSGRRPPAGPKARCVTAATPPRSAAGERAPTAASTGGWSHHRALAPPAAVTAPVSPPCTPAGSAGARTSSTSGAAAIDAHSPAAPPSS